jgi:hypothetical protein
MEKKNPLNWKRIILETTVVILATVLVSWAISTQIHMTAPAAPGSANFYTTEAANELITTPWDWSLHGITGLHNGDIITVWLKNTGSTNLFVNVTILNPSCVITATPNSLISLSPDAVQAVNLNFSGIVSGPTISWDLKADY